MPKRFKLQTGHIVTVDESDAYLLRAYVWNGTTSQDGGVVVRRAGPNTTDSYLSHVIAGEAGKAYVMHANGDSCDFTRSNLKAVTREEFYVQQLARMRAIRQEKRNESKHS